MLGKKQDKLIGLPLEDLLSAGQKRKRQEDRKFWIKICKDNHLNLPEEVVTYQATEFLKDTLISSPDRIQYVYEAQSGECHRVMMRHDWDGYLIGGHFLPHMPSDLLYEKFQDIFGNSEQENIDKIPRNGLVDSFSAITNKEKAEIYISILMGISKMSYNQIKKYCSGKIKKILDNRHVDAVNIGQDFNYKEIYSL